MTISSLDEYLRENPHLRQMVCGAPGIGDPIRLGLRKPDGAFREAVSHVKRSHYGNNIDIR